MKLNQELFKRKLLLLIAFLCMNMTGFSQVITYRGLVKLESGETVPGVAVVEKGTTKGTITDLDGNFSISSSKSGIVLEISFIGYITQTIKPTPGKPIQVVLKEDVVGLEEVVVVGYGEQKKESLISAISTVSSDELESVGVPNLSNALNGMATGLNAVVNSGQPGSESADLYIRGRSSVNDDKALVIVDGIEQEGNFSNIDPSEVSSISVLKDAAATAVYGVKGANGVIIITTKRGKKGVPVINFNTETGIKMPTVKVKTLGSYDVNTLYNVALKNDQRWDELISDEVLQHYKDQDMPYIYPDVNWYDEVMKKAAVGTRNSINASGGNDFVSYFTSVSYLYDTDIFKTREKNTKFANYDPQYRFDKWNFRSNLDFQITSSTKFSADISGRIEKKNQPGIDGERKIFHQMYVLPPSAYPAYYPEELLEQYPDSYTWLPSGDRPGYKYLGLLYSPVFCLNEQGQKSSKRNVLTTDFRLNQKLDFLTKGLSLGTRYTYSSSSNYTKGIGFQGMQYFLTEDGEWEYYTDFLKTVNDPVQAPMSTGSENLNTWGESFYYETRLNYNRKFGSHKVTALMLMSRKEVKNKDSFPRFFQDYVGKLTYNYKYKYFLESASAYNGTNLFAPGKRLGFFPSIALGWIVSEEPFFKNNLPWINYLKLRGTIGQSGSMSGSSLYMYLGEYGTKSSKYFQFGTNHGNQGGVILEKKIANPDATWETATKKNLGVDVSFLNNKFAATAEFWHELREDIFISPNRVPTYYGNIAGIPKANLGEIESHGLELELEYRNKTDFGLDYFVKGTYAFSENRMREMDDRFGTPDYQKKANVPIKTESVLCNDGFLESVDEAVNYASASFALDGAMPGYFAYADFNGDGIISDLDKVYQGFSEVPRKTYGLTVGGKFKSWNFRVFLIAADDYNYIGDGKDPWLYPFQNELPNGRPTHFNYWTQNNLDAKWPTPSVYNTYNDRANTFKVLDASYVRLKSMELGYTYKPKGLLGVKKMRFYVNANNLFTWSKIKNGDPEGKNIGRYPMVKRFNMGLNVSF